jgi:glycosyl transferase/beta-hydroxylase protein BlmF
MIQSVLDTVNHPERIELCFYIDEDDPQRESYCRMFPDYEKKIECRVYIDEPMSVSKSWNLIAEDCTGDILKMGNDDILYRTKGWDDRLDQEAAKFPDDIYVMWFHDGNSNACTFPIVSRKWYEALGYFTPGIFQFIANDTWIQRIGKTVGRLHYVPNVLNEHVRYDDKGELLKDKVYDRNRVGDGVKLDQEFFYGPEGKKLWTEHAQRILKAMDK